MKKINENTKVTLTFDQLKRLVKESNLDTGLADLTWGDLKKMMAENGVKDDTVIYCGSVEDRPTNGGPIYDVKDIVCYGGETFDDDWDEDYPKEVFLLISKQ